MKWKLGEYRDLRNVKATLWSQACGFRGGCGPVSEIGHCHHILGFRAQDLGQDLSSTQLRADDRNESSEGSE